MFTTDLAHAGFGGRCRMMTLTSVSTKVAVKPLGLLWENGSQGHRSGGLTRPGGRRRASPGCVLEVDSVVVLGEGGAR